MKLYQKRVVAEKAELDAKRKKLAAFLDGEIYETEISALELWRLNRQFNAMTLYSDILGERIDAFGSNIKV